MFHNKEAIIGIYAQAVDPGTIPGYGATLTNFIVETTGPVFVNWGDGTAYTIDENTPTTHTFICREASLDGFWDNIVTC